MPLNNYQKMCYRWFGRTAESVVTDKMKGDLESAHITIRSGAYISCIWVNTIMAAVISTIVYFSLILVISPDLFLVFVLAIIPIMSTTFSYLYFKSIPASRAKSRAKKIDLHLPYALNFISAMSSAGITPTETFKNLREDFWEPVSDMVKTICEQFNIQIITTSVLPIFNDVADNIIEIKKEKGVSVAYVES